MGSARTILTLFSGTILIIPVRDDDNNLIIKTFKNPSPVPKPRSRDRPPFSGKSRENKSFSNPDLHINIFISK